MPDRNLILAALVSLALAVYVLVITTGVSLAQGATDGVLIDDVDATEFPAVTVSITGPSTLAGVTLSDEDIAVFEDGREREAFVVSVPTEDLEVVLLVDTSGSMSGAPITQARQAAAAFIDRMPPSTRIAVVGFGPTPTVVSDFTTDPDAARGAVEALAVSGETALYDAVAAAVGEFEPGTGAQRRLVIVSDGGDTASGAPIDVPLALLRNSDIQVQVISLVTAESDGPALQALATAGSGRVVEASDPDALASVFDTVAAALVSQYEVIFSAERGGETEITVTIETEAHSSSDSAEVLLPVAVVPVEAASEPPLTAPPAEPAAPPAVVAAPVVRIAADPVASWLLPAGLVAVFLGLAGLFWFVTRPGRRQNVLRSLTPAAVDSTRSLGGLLRGTPGLVTNLANGTLSRRGRERRLELELSRAGIELRPSEFLLLCSVIVIGAVLVGILATGIFGGLALGGIAYVGVRLTLQWMGRRRQRAFADQLHGILTMMAGSLRSGYSLSQSIDAVAREVESPAADEFNRAMVEVQLGRDLTEAFDGIADRVDNEDFRWVVEAIEISRTVGGNLGEVLDNVASTIRERDRVARHVRTLSAEGRISAWILSALPFIMAAYLSVVNPEYLSHLTATDAGHVVLTITGVVVVIGILWMRRIVRPEF